MPKPPSTPILKARDPSRFGQNKLERQAERLKPRSKSNDAPTATESDWVIVDDAPPSRSVAAKAHLDKPQRKPHQRRQLGKALAKNMPGPTGWATTGVLNAGGEKKIERLENRIAATGQDRALRLAVADAAQTVLHMLPHRASPKLNEAELVDLQLMARSKRLGVYADIAKLPADAIHKLHSKGVLNSEYAIDSKYVDPNTGLLLAKKPSGVKSELWEALGKAQAEFLADKSSLEIAVGRNQQRIFDLLEVLQLANIDLSKVDSADADALQAVWRKHVEQRVAAISRALLPAGAVSRKIAKQIGARTEAQLYGLVAEQFNAIIYNALMAVRADAPVAVLDENASVSPVDNPNAPSETLTSKPVNAEEQDFGATPGLNKKTLQADLRELSGATDLVAALRGLSSDSEADIVLPAELVDWFGGAAALVEFLKQPLDEHNAKLSISAGGDGFYYVTLGVDSSVGWKRWAKSKFFDPRSPAVDAICRHIKGNHPFVAVEKELAKARSRKHCKVETADMSREHVQVLDDFFHARGYVIKQGEDGRRIYTQLGSVVTDELTHWMEARYGAKIHQATIAAFKKFATGQLSTRITQSFLQLGAMLEPERLDAMLAARLNQASTPQPQRSVPASAPTAVSPRDIDTLTREVFGSDNVAALIKKHGLQVGAPIAAQMMNRLIRPDELALDVTHMLSAPQTQYAVLHILDALVVAWGESRNA